MIDELPRRTVDLGAVMQALAQEARDARQQAQAYAVEQARAEERAASAERHLQALQSLLAPPTSEE
jgi:outer membrane murein-binding lipoprotein Lpp